ncbi:hypothetical protein AB7W40_15060 [Providencia rettgeri]
MPKKPITEIYTAEEAEELSELIADIIPMLARDSRNKKQVIHLLDYAQDLLDCFPYDDDDDFEPILEGTPNDQLI